MCRYDAGVLKEFLREMPEPLCSDSLYQMLLDALNVQISGDADGNARLMLGVLDCLPAVNQVNSLGEHTLQSSTRRRNGCSDRLQQRLHRVFSTHSRYCDNANSSQVPVTTLEIS